MEEEVVGLKEKVSDFVASSKVHEERCINYDITTTNKLNTMNEKVHPSFMRSCVLLFICHRFLRSANLLEWTHFQKGLQVLNLSMR